MKKNIKEKLDHLYRTKQLSIPRVASSIEFNNEDATESRESLVESNKVEVAVNRQI